jgi:2-polyprenyl-3-methyl-5-hydroxy-6-metoxy-1,4-benzoquinol methylase
MKVGALISKKNIYYLFTSVMKQMLRNGMDCPSCGCKKSVVLDRKYIATSLRRCDACHLLFRVPTTSENEFVSFYQDDYREGFTTSMPDKSNLDELLATKFAGTEKDYSAYIEILRAAGAKPGSKVFDFGCSWGYGSWQFQQAGFDTTSFEISGHRAEYARNNLGILVTSDPSSVRGEYDIFFSSHVLEHLSSVSSIINFAFERLKPGGLFIALTPNGSTGYRSVNPEGWHRIWGYVHPNMLDEQYYKNVFCGRSYYISSPPFKSAEIEAWAATSNNRIEPVIAQISGEELLVIVRK